MCIYMTCIILYVLCLWFCIFLLFTTLMCSWISCGVAEHKDGANRKWVPLLRAAPGASHAQFFLSTTHWDLTGTLSTVAALLLFSLSFFFYTHVGLGTFLGGASFWFFLFDSWMITPTLADWHHDLNIQGNCPQKRKFLQQWNWLSAGGKDGRKKIGVTKQKKHYFSSAPNTHKTFQSMFTHGCCPS